MRHRNRLGQKKVQAMKKDIEEMWNQLENSYNIEGITQMENEIKDHKQTLLTVY